MNSMYRIYPEKRYRKTLAILQRFAPKGTSILDLGVRNPFSEVMEKEGYVVHNTQGEDLDLHPEILKSYQGEMVTALEILGYYNSFLQKTSSLQYLCAYGLPRPTAMTKTREIVTTMSLKTGN